MTEFAHTDLEAICLDYMYQANVSRQIPSRQKKTTASRPKVFRSKKDQRCMEMFHTPLMFLCPHDISRKIPRECAIEGFSHNRVHIKVFKNDRIRTYRRLDGGN